MTGGYIKIYRQLLDWEWYGQPIVTMVFLHLLLTVNIQDSKWQGIEVPRGSRVTSYRKLADELGLTVRQIRDTLNKLERSGEIARKATNKYTLIRIVKFDFFQSERHTERHTERQANGTQNDNQKANKGQQNKNIKEDIRNKEKIPASPAVIPSAKTAAELTNEDFNREGLKTKEDYEDKRRRMFGAPSGGDNSGV